VSGIAPPNECRARWCETYEVWVAYEVVVGDEVPLDAGAGDVAQIAVAQLFEHFNGQLVAHAQPQTCFVDKSINSISIFLGINNLFHNNINKHNNPK
jgi:hypothetical protein